VVRYVAEQYFDRASSALQQLLLDIGVDPHFLATSEHIRTTVKYHALNLVPCR
jgi:hypothetical protein